MNMQIEGEKVPMHGAGILLTEKKMKKKQKTKNGICFALIWFFVSDFTAPCLSEFATFLFDS